MMHVQLFWAVPPSVAKPGKTRKYSHRGACKSLSHSIVMRASIVNSTEQADNLEIVGLCGSREHFRDSVQTITLHSELRTLAARALPSPG